LFELKIIPKERIHIEITINIPERIAMKLGTVGPTVNTM